MSDLPLHDALAIPAPGSEESVVLATVGGGGKTTLLFAIAAERAAGRRDESVSVLTTTTKFTVPARAQQFPTVLATNPLVRAAAIADVRGKGLPTVLVAGGRGERGRLLGVERDWPRQALGIDGVSFVGVEADGSAGRPFKAPASHEPVIPAGVTHVVAVVGVEVLGKPLDARSVHRPELAAAIAGVEEGEAVTAEIVALVLSDAEGGRKGVPPSGSNRARFAVMVTRVGRDREGARAIGQACREKGLDVVVGWDAWEGCVEELAED